MSSFNYMVTGGDSFGSVTNATGGQAFVQFIPPMSGCITNITYLDYTAPADDHTLTLMRPLNWTVLTADAAASATSISIKTDPGKYATNWAYRPGVTPSTADNAVASGDYVALQLADGTWFQTKTTSAVSAGAVSVGALPTGGALKGARVYFFGVPADTNPNTGAAHPALLPAQSTTTTYDATTASGFVFRGMYPNDPLIVHSDNATAQGTLNRTSVIYTKF